MNLNDFAKWMNARADRVVSEANRVKRLAALAVDQVIVMATPVDTGRARSNWLVSADEPRDDTIEPYDPLPSESKDKLGETANAQAAIDQAKEVIAEVSSGQSIHVTNNLPYIQRLDEGWSAQAPAGFVEESVEAGIRAIDGAKIDLER